MNGVEKAKTVNEGAQFENSKAEPTPVQQLLCRVYKARRIRLMVRHLLSQP